MAPLEEIVERAADLKLKVADCDPHADMEDIRDAVEYLADLVAWLASCVAAMNKKVGADLLGE